jgi:hypothetical protein
MAMEPMTLFARIADPAAVAQRLREVARDVVIEGTDETWKRAVVTFDADGLKRTLTLTHDPSYYADPTWSTQMAGMRNYMSEFRETARKTRALMLTTTFRFALGTLFEPDFDPQGDPRLDVLFAVAERLDAVLFTPSSLRDAQGRILFGAGGAAEEDDDAAWPLVLAVASASEVIGTAHGMSRPGKSDDEAAAATAPTAQRVARRALALTAVTARAILEQDWRSRHPKEHPRLLDWVQTMEIGSELEPDEWEVLQRPLGRLDQRQQINATRRLEGLVILAWALGRSPIPPHDKLVKYKRLWRTLGLRDPKAAGKLLADPVLRPRAEIISQRNRLFALHWRLRNFRLHAVVMDFAEFARTCWFGPLDLTGLRLVKGDLGLRGRRLDRVSSDVFSAAESSALERHLAANWLWGGRERYSRASQAT